MKIISNKIHGILDLITVLAFALIPSVFALNSTPAYLSYTLAVVHLLMTLLTRFQFGLVKVIPVRVHKWVETAVGPILLVISWVLGFSDDTKARTIFMVMGAVIIIVGLTSRYHELES